MKPKVVAWAKWSRSMLGALALSAGLVGSLVTTSAVNAGPNTPGAGTEIKNTASATYTNSLGQPNQSALSNEVVTTVQQGASATLTSSQTITIPPTGGASTTVLFPHTLPPITFIRET